MEEKSESLADKTLDEKAPQKPEPKLEAASLLGKIFTLMRKKREQDVRYSQQEQLQQSQAQLKELEMRIKILESIKESKDEVEDEKPGKKPKAKKEPKQKKSKKSFGYPDGFAGFLVDATIVSGLILKYNKESEQTQKEVEEVGQKLEEYENLDILSTERKDTGTIEEPKTKIPEVPTAPAVPTPPAAPVKPTPSTSSSTEEGMKDYEGRGSATQEPVKPTAKPIEQPQKPPLTATKQPEPPVPPATAQKESTKKSTKTLSQSIAQKISRGESRGDSKASYTQANIVGKESKEANIVKGNIDVTTGKAFEKSLDEMTIGEVIQLGKRRYVYYTKKYGKPVGGSAMGKYQFIPGSLEEVAKKLYSSDYKNKLYDEQGQEDLNAAFISDNATRLKNAGVKASDASLYMMHFFGNPTQAALVVNGDENASMTDVLDFWYNEGKQKVKPSDQNTSVAAMTIGQYKDYLRKKGFDFQDIDITKLNEPIKAPGAGAAIDDTSTQNSAAKADAKATQSSVTNNIATQTQQNRKAKSPQNKNEDDRSAYSKKVNE